ncbi:MAG TPA: DUF4382 domain-containing protein [Gammaproteobacteria bacterium]|nr:DUF4382 domain-containing protein [Gammaproteobacteria bacterium]
MRYLNLCLALTLFTLAGCGGGSSEGHVNFDITDSPADSATSIVVEFTGLTAVPQTGVPVHYQFPQPLQIDLAQLQSGTSAPLLQNLQLPAGHYRSLTLELSATPGAKDSFVVDATGKHGLVFTGSSTVIPDGFDVVADEGSSFIIDFDMRKSVLPPAASSSDFQLAPRLRMLDERSAGNIIGSVPANFAAAAGCVPVVYVYAGIVTRPGDLRPMADGGNQPVTEAPVKLDTAFGPYRFTAAYLPAGTYTLAFTCDAAQDDPSKTDNIVFPSMGSVVAEAGNTTLTALH